MEKEIIIDNNILFAAMRPQSVSAYLFSAYFSKIFAPDFILHEFKRHEEECQKKTGLSRQEFEMRQKDIFKKITIIGLNEYGPFLEKARAAVIDRDDAPYVACALFMDVSIWSEDRHLLQQNLVNAYSTAMLIEALT